ncbi:MAG: 50S ribosomal protein L23 [Bacteroidales bacterium]|jgi:large subunit ribosomal protein L23
MGIIIKPIVTEKMTALTEKRNTYGFRVAPDANKIQIKQAIEELYSVAVVDVNTSNVTGKLKSRNTKAGVVQGRSASYKKALVTLKDGDIIDFYSNI